MLTVYATMRRHHYVYAPGDAVAVLGAAAAFFAVMYALLKLFPNISKKTARIIALAAGFAAMFVIKSAQGA